MRFLQATAALLLTTASSVSAFTGTAPRRVGRSVTTSPASETAAVAARALFGTT
jgi:hypothetical protein